AHWSAAPPMRSRSINVTSAPSDAATVAAVLPPGPPPMITKRTGTRPGYARAPAYPDTRAGATNRRADGDKRDRRARPRHPTRGVRDRFFWAVGGVRTVDTATRLPVLSRTRSDDATRSRTYRRGRG